MKFLFWPAAVAVAVGRWFVPGHGLSWPGTYEALAHIWAGIMLALIWPRVYTYKEWYANGGENYDNHRQVVTPPPHPWATYVLVGLTVYEIFMALNRR